MSYSTNPFMYYPTNIVSSQLLLEKYVLFTQQNNKKYLSFFKKIYFVGFGIFLDIHFMFQMFFKGPWWKIRLQLQPAAEAAEIWL